MAMTHIVAMIAFMAVIVKVAEADAEERSDRKPVTAGFLTLSIGGDPGGPTRWRGQSRGQRAHLDICRAGDDARKLLKMAEGDGFVPGAA
jgi:hypothetical protein